jgi:hypothetical protein
MNVERKADNRPDAEPARGFERRADLEPERGSIEEGAEKSKGAVSKSVVPLTGTDGSNPSPSAGESVSAAETLPNGRVELFAGYGHGVSLLQPERCARAAVGILATYRVAVCGGPIP